MKVPPHAIQPFSSTADSRAGGLVKTMLVAVTLVISACGGGGGGSSGGPPAAVGGGTTGGGTQQPGFASGTFASSDDFKDLCANPRGAGSPDRAGTTQDENNWLRSWSNELYLWYDEIEDQDPAGFTTPAYFDLMKTNATTSSGAPKDKFHFTIPTDEWIAQSQSGISAGYGAEFAVLAGTPPREVAVAFANPGTPAAGQNLSRGARVLSVDGVDMVNGTDTDTLNAGLFPSDVGETHTFVVQDLGATSTRTITMTSAQVTEDPVQFDQLINTPSGPVGYLFFSAHIATAEAELVAAMSNFASAGVTEMIVDLRYNRGGFLDIANELAFMVAGGAASGQVFDEIQFNDKHTVTNPVTGAALTPTRFHEVTQDFSGPAGQPLPTLNLSRLFVLTTADTCSASEAIINGLRGIGVEVVLIGETTCGKPYGFYAFDNCGTSYFSIQFRGVNAQNFGDYSDGFSPEVGARIQGTTVPGCYVEDDYDNALGDPAEAQLAAALGYIATSACPASSSGSAAPRGLAQRWGGLQPEGGVVQRPWRPGAVIRQ